MKKFLLILSAGAFLAFGGWMLTGCTKEGPQGPAGTDASATCKQCHNWDDSITTKIYQYDASQHASGDVVQRGASGTGCAACHTSQGFNEVIVTGADTTAAPVPDGAPINCRTCHKIHETYTTTDWDLKIKTAYHPLIDKTQTINLADDGNLCGRCHQARKAAPWLTNPKGTDSLTITSANKRWGPHHGPQSEMLAGFGAFEMGATAYGSSPHRNSLGCNSCHMSNPQGKFVGGHTLWMTSDETGDNVKKCNTSGCHSGVTSFDLNGDQTEIEGLIQQLKVKLAVANIFDTTQMVMKPGKYPQIQLAIVWNFLMVEEDRSLGVHNYQYAHDMLQSGIDYFGAKGF